MLRDQAEETMDMEVLDEAEIEDLNKDYIRGYRNSHKSFKPGHPFERLDYRENPDMVIRWTDRLQSSSGEWSGNLFDFYFRVYNKIIKDIKVPFKMEGGFRVDDTPVHRALREALANCIINSSTEERNALFKGLIFRAVPCSICTALAVDLILSFILG